MNVVTGISGRYGSHLKDVYVGSEEIHASFGVN